ncbi:HMG box domain-containing protein [Favolaschia claudopus]|uniref:HMG box domain-containing protein n=1 Tax=Favolaschia claudopus TaxID=2862362 RepID=A0AAW0BGA3_9AGAR
MSSPTRVLGWTSVSPDGDIVDPQRAHQFTFQLDAAPKRSSSSSVDPPSIGILPSKESKIPRPPNSFIIFRAEYTRLHKKPGARRGDTAVVGLSRKAADAWHLLPPEEKQRYQQLAEIAKEKHSRAYPNYQYRPQRQHKNNNARRPPYALVPKPRPPRLPSPTLTVSTAVSSDNNTISSPIDQPPPSPESAPLEDPSVTTTKSDRRRSSSVPVTLGEQLFNSVFLPGEDWDQPERPPKQLSKRRSRSVTQNWNWNTVDFMPSPPQPFGVGFDPQRVSQNVFLTSRPDLRPHAHFPHPASAQLHTLNPAALFTPAEHMSPLAAVASSLAGWDGGVSTSSTGSSSTSPVGPTPVPSCLPPKLSAPQPLRMNAPAWISSPETVLMYDSAAVGDVVEETDDLDSRAAALVGDKWPLERGAYVVGAGLSLGAPWSGTTLHEIPPKIPVTGTDAEDEGYLSRAAALQEYELGLKQRVHGNGGIFDDSMDFDFDVLDAEDLDLHYNYEYVDPSQI